MFNAWYYYRTLTSTFCFFQMKNAETNILTAMWWSKLASACTTTTRLHAVHHAHKGAPESSFSGDAVSALKQGPSAPDSALCRPPAPGPLRATNYSHLGFVGQLLFTDQDGNWRRKISGGSFSRCCWKIIQKRRNAFPWRMRQIYRHEEEVKRRSIWITWQQKKSSSC